MIIKKVITRLPSKRQLHTGEAVIVDLKPGQLAPEDLGGKFLYVRVAEELHRVPVEKVEWGG